MLGTPLLTFAHSVFYSMIDRDDPQVLGDYYAANIENWIIRNRGQLEMRDGITTRGDSPSATNLGASYLRKSDGTKKFLRVVNGAGNTSKFQDSENGSTWTDVSGGGSKSSNARWALVQANDSIYGVNGLDTPIKYNGSAVSTVSAIPQGIAIEWWKNHMWVFGNPTTKDRAYFSNANDPETWGGSDFININLGDVSAGIGIKGTAGDAGRLYLGKERSIWYITGSSSSNWALNILTYEHGVASHESMISVKNDVWCVDLEGNVRSLYRTDTDNPFSSLRSWPIPQTIAGLNRAAITKTSAVFFDNYAMFFVPNGVDTHNSLVLVLDTQANEGKGGWLKFTGWNIARAVIAYDSAVPRLFLFDSREGNGQAYQWTGASDNGIAITAKYETKIYDHGYPSQEKKWKFAYQYAPVIGTATLKFYVSIDRFYYVKLADISLQGTGNKLLGQTWTLGTDKLGFDGFVRQKINYTDNGGDNAGFSQQVKLEAESSSTKVKIRQFTSHYRLKGLH